MTAPWICIDAENKKENVAGFLKHPGVFSEKWRAQCACVTIYVDISSSCIVCTKDVAGADRHCSRKKIQQLTKKNKQKGSSALRQFFSLGDVSTATMSTTTAAWHTHEGRFAGWNSAASQMRLCQMGSSVFVSFSWTVMLTVASAIVLWCTMHSNAKGFDDFDLFKRKERNLHWPKHSQFGSESTAMVGDIRAMLPPWTIDNLPK